jgi:hypothetical protein
LIGLIIAVMSGCIVRGRQCGTGATGFKAFSCTTQEAANGGTLDCQLTVEGLDEVGSRKPIDVRVLLTNAASEEFTIVLYNEFPTHMSLTMPSGAPAPLTAFGRDLFATRDYITAPGITVTAGLSYVWKVDLRRVYTFPVSGTYRLKIGESVIYQAAGNLESKTVDLEQAVDFRVVNQ